MLKIFIGILFVSWKQLIALRYLLIAKYLLLRFLLLLRVNGLRKELALITFDCEWSLKGSFLLLQSIILILSLVSLTWLLLVDRPGLLK
jgi:hypothetical protein